jgi:hypothetical protein
MFGRKEDRCLRDIPSIFDQWAEDLSIYSRGQRNNRLQGVKCPHLCLEISRGRKIQD